MKAQITIECETVSELITHLDVLKKQIVDKAKEINIKVSEDEFPQMLRLTDGNCYGDHVALITPEDPR